MLFFSSYLGAVPMVITFQELHQSSSDLQLVRDNFHEKEIAIRGFLYYIDEKMAILSPEPNLKSCCLGSSNKVLEQIRVEPFELISKDQAENRVVLLQGTLFVEPLRDLSGQLTQIFRLGNAVEIPIDNGVDLKYLFLVCLAIVAIFLLKKRFL
jgi:hypothetical protein